jgi:peroxiredoxin
MSTGECTGHGSPQPQRGAGRRRRGYRWRRPAWSGPNGGSPDRGLAQPVDRDPIDPDAHTPSGSSEQQSDGEAAVGTEIDRDPQRMIARLRGVAIPMILLESCQARAVDLASLANDSLAIYFYPGDAGFPTAWQRSIAVDARLHGAFRDLKKDLTRYRCEVVGVSSQPAWIQVQSTADGGLEHDLLSDPMLQLAGELALSTTELDGRQFYEQQVLIVRGGRIRHVFYPAATDRCAHQVAAWLKLN